MSKRKLLLADDSVTIQKVVNLTFADEGIEVVTVGDGDSAMQTISEAAPDVVLADVHMPGLSGYQVCELVRKNPATSDLPVVLLVGSFEPFDEAEAERVGASAYLTKPFQSIRQLVAQVFDLMPSTGDEPAAEETRETEQAASMPEEISAADEPEQVAETSDIDSLYEESLNEPVTDEHEPAPQFVDAGMDDEMIETIPAEEYSMAAADTDEFREDEVDHFPHVPQSVPGSSPFDSPAMSDTSAAVATARDDSVVEFDPRFARTEKMPDSFVATATTEADFDLDEIELLELPPMGSAKTIEFTTAERVAIEHGRQVVNLSPELMEIIVQKVVERLKSDSE